MERALSTEERIRKAEEIYNRRKNANLREYNLPSDKKKISFSLFKKMILQIIVCIVIYSAFYIIKNKNYIFTESVLSKTSEILKYDIDFSNLYTSTVNYIKTNIENMNIKGENGIGSENNENSENSEEKEVNNETGNAVNGKGGGEKNEKKESKTQMELDAEYVSENVKLIKPVEGIVTSRFRKKRSK